MDPHLVIPLAVTLSFLLWGTAAKLFAAPALAKLSKEDALTRMILPHGVRFLGLAFVIPGVVSPMFPADFGAQIAYGDLAAVVLMYAALVALRRRSPNATALVWIFNVVGALDLLNALVQGLIRVTSPGLLAGTYVILALFVPCMLTLHAMIFARLLKKA